MQNNVESSHKTAQSHRYKQEPHKTGRGAASMAVAKPHDGPTHRLARKEQDPYSVDGAREGAETRNDSHKCRGNDILTPKVSFVRQERKETSLRAQSQRNP
jgi:hypothetical protein